MGLPPPSYSQQFNLQVVPYLVVTVETTYLPSRITVPVGSTVAWVRLNGAIDQYDNGAHDVVFNNGMGSSGTMAQYDTYSYAFGTSGTFVYHCSFHPTMQGTVIVT